MEISTDKVWRSERISRDGFDNLNFSEGSVTVLAFEPTSDGKECKSFSFNYRAKEIIGGTYQFENKTKLPMIFFMA
jgi:hypothetical protein